VHYSSLELELGPGLAKVHYSWPEMGPAKAQELAQVHYSSLELGPGLAKDSRHYWNYPQARYCE
jgi:hypothetical protein